MSLFREDTKLQGLKGKDLRKLDLARYNVVVEDADTILLEEKGLLGFFKSPLAIRLAGIDAPEIAKHSIWDYKKALVLGYMGLEEDQPHAQEAKEWLEQRIKNSKGLVAYTAPDQQTYGRSVGVLADEYSNINLQLLQYGQATALPYGSKEQDVLSRSMATKQEAFARENTLGLWNYKRYQVQHELLGSSLTHNQLMRADRDDSYVGYRKAQLGALGNQQLDSRFSARDDNYNIIEGLGHQGIAHYLRRVMTPFGSGFRPGIEMPPALKGLHGLSDYVIFDLETSGLDKAKDQALEIAGIKYRAGKEVERFHSFVRPDIEITPGAQKVHKLSARLLNRVGQSREEAYSAFSKFVGDLPLVGHNIEDFDLPFLNADLERLGLGKLTNPTVDTLRAAKGALPDIGGYKLEGLTKELGLPPRRAHRAMEDVLAVGDLIPKLKSSSAFASTAEQTTKRAMSPLLRKGLLIGGGLALTTAAIYGIRAISGNPADYNSIEGLSSGSYAQQSKRTTGVDFSSPWDALRKHASKIGMSFTDLLSDTKFKSTLSQALNTVGGESGKEGGFLLGRGAFGSAYKMTAEVTYGGHTTELPFVRKILHSGLPPGDIPSGYGSAAATAKGDFSLQHEASHLQSLIGEEHVPTFYGFNRQRNFLDQEFIEGRTLLSATENYMTEPQLEAFVSRTKGALQDIYSRKGLAHGDAHSQNLFVPKEDPTHPILLDWGQAKKAGEMGGSSKYASNRLEQALPHLKRNISKREEMKKLLDDPALAAKKPGTVKLQTILARREPMRMQSIMSQGAQQHNRLQGARVEPQSLAMLDDPFNKR